MLSVSGLIFAILFAAAFPSLAATPADFRFSRPLAAPAPPGGPSSARPSELATVELDEIIHAITDDNASDLRVFDESNTEIPFIVRPRRQEITTEQEYTVGAIQQDFRVLPDNGIAFVLQRTNAWENPVAVAFDTPLDNFEKRVTIAASPDGTTWETLVEHQAIFDYSRYMDVRRLRVDLPASSLSPPGGPSPARPPAPAPHAYFRIAIANITEAQESPLAQFERDQRGGATFSEVERRTFTRTDFRIDRARLIGRRPMVVKQELLQRPYPITDVLVKDDTEKRVTVITFASGRAPITELAIEATTPNFNRHATVEGRTETATWIPIASGTLRRLRTTGFQEDALVLKFPRPVRVTQMRLTIQNLDSPPLVLDRIHARGETHEVVWFHDPARRYRLCYGAPNMPAPRYDVAAALQSADTATATRATLGPPEQNPAYRASAARGWWNSRHFLIAAVVLVVIALGWALTRAAKQIES